MNKPHPSYLFSGQQDDIPAWAKRIEQKLDTLIAALAGDDEEEQPVRSLDDGRTFPARNDRKGLG